MHPHFFESVRFGMVNGLYLIMVFCHFMSIGNLCERNLCKRVRGICNKLLTVINK